MGPILQELLDGVKSRSQFELLRGYMETFPLVDLSRRHYVEASSLRNHCRSRGIQAGAVDFLIATVCIHENFPLLTADNDFFHIARHSKLMLVPVDS